MKSFLFWLARAAQAVLALQAFCLAYKWLQSIEKTHAMADVTMYLLELLVGGFIAYYCYESIKNRYATR